MDTQNNVKQFALKLYAKQMARELTEVLGVLKAARRSLSQTEVPRNERQLADAVNAFCGLEGKDKIHQDELADIRYDAFSGYNAATELLAKIDSAIDIISETIDEL